MSNKASTATTTKAIITSTAKRTQQYRSEQHNNYNSNNTQSTTTTRATAKRAQQQEIEPNNNKNKCKDSTKRTHQEIKSSDAVDLFHVWLEEKKLNGRAQRPFFPTLNPLFYNPPPSPFCVPDPCALPPARVRPPVFLSLSFYCFGGNSFASFERSLPVSVWREE